MKAKQIFAVVLSSLFVATLSSVIVLAKDAGEVANQEQLSVIEQNKEFLKQKEEEYNQNESVKIWRTQQKKIREYYKQVADRGYNTAVELVQKNGDFTEGADRSLLEKNGDYYMDFVISLCEAYNKFKPELSPEDSIVIEDYLDNSYDVIKAKTTKTEKSQTALDLIAETIIPSYPVESHVKKEINYQEVINERKSKLDEYDPGKALDELLTARVIVRNAGYYKDDVDFDLLDTDENYYLDFVSTVCDAYNKAEMSDNIKKTAEIFLNHSKENITTKFKENKKAQTVINTINSTLQKSTSD